MLRDLDNRGTARTMDRYSQEAFDFVTGPAARDAFSLNREDPRLRDRYGRHSWGQSALLARRLVEAGSTFVTVHLGGWDHHWDLEASYVRLLPIVDSLVYGLFTECAEENALGGDVEIDVEGYDECNTVIDVEQTVRRIREADLGFVGLVGVQSNQFPRAMDLAVRFREAGIQVAIGGFHVSGCLAMLPELPPDLAAAQRLWVSLFAGEAEGRLAGLFADAFAGRLQPIYNYMDDLPGLQQQVTPFLPLDIVRRYGETTLWYGHATAATS